MARRTELAPEAAALLKIPAGRLEAMTAAQITARIAVRKLTDEQTAVVRAYENVNQARSAAATKAAAARKAAKEQASTEQKAAEQAAARAAIIERCGEFAEDEHLLTATVGGRCTRCREWVERGSEVFWSHQTRRLRHAAKACPQPAPKPARVYVAREYTPAPRKAREYPNHVCYECGARWEGAAMDCVMSRDGEGPHRWVPAGLPTSGAARLAEEQY